MIKPVSATFWLLLGAVCSAVGCSGAQGSAEPARTTEPPRVDGHLFTKLPASYTGVDFTNRVVDSQEQNVFNYRNHYNGGGVALGDLTGDGLPEVVLTSNQDGARLYLNEGKFRFRDVTKSAGFDTDRAWTTGVTIADVNGDGRLDVYICHAGREAGKRRANELFVNQGLDGNGAPKFKEMAAAYGIADEGYSTQGAFVDYDRDGDLDLMLIRNSPKPVTSFGSRNTRHVRDSLGGGKLYRNDPSPDGSGQARHFVDASEKAGIFGPENAFGLGLVVADVNRDGWPDVYTSNDYYERDYLYLNNKDGTFAESLEQKMRYASYFSMGLDVADLNNDGWPDVYTTDMLPDDEYRLRTTTSFEGWDVYQAKLRGGYGHQLMRNMLQRNDGDGTFSEVGQMAGVARTDWSWSALIADLDLDGHKDIFVTNGLVKDVTSQDYVAFLADQETMASVTKGGRVDFMRLIGAMPSTPLANYAFHNKGDLTFANESAAWGLDTPSFSNGAAYADLDADGAPDLVVNNANQEAFVYRNNARTLRKDNRFLQLRLEGEGANRFAVGAAVTLRSGDQLQYQELEATRGFQSSVDPVLTFGLGARDTVDTLTVDWPDGRRTVQTHVAADQRLTVRQAGATSPAAPTATPNAPLLAALADSSIVPFVHRENDFVDFDRERLIPKMLSTEGPLTAVGDVSGDKLDDMFIGGAKDQPGQLMIQQPDGRLVASNPGLFEQDAVSEDAGAQFFDADEDGDVDLYVVSGGNEFGADAPALQDRLYLNDGRGTFSKAVGHLPAETASGSRAAAADFDGDGDIDLFVGGRSVPWRYGETPQSMLLANDGRGHFTDVTDRVAPGLAQVGMVTDATWQDVDGDRRPDLVVVGEWMPVTVFHNAKGGRLARLDAPGLEQSEGWWNRIVAGDFTGDGRVDFIVGNLGLNTRLQASSAEPTTMYVKDFDGNGSTEQIVACYNHGASYPIVLRDDLLRALPYLKTRYLRYEAYARQTVTDIFPRDTLAPAIVRQARTFATTLVRNDGNGRFTLVPLPREAQLAPVYGILARDLDGDGNSDLLLAGNFDGVKPEIGPMSASHGLFLRGDGQSHFAALSARESGFFVPGQARDIQRLRTRESDLYVIARNNDRPLVFRSIARPRTRTLASSVADRR